MSGRIYPCRLGPMQPDIKHPLGIEIAMRKLLGLILVWQAAGNTMRADETFTLREQFPPGYQYHVSSRVDLEGRLTMPAEKGKEAQSLQVTGQSALEYDERI